MVNDTSLEEDAKNDLNMNESNTIGALQNMNFISKTLDAYDLIDFSLLDDGYSEIQEENCYNYKEFEKFPFCNSCDQLYTCDDALVYSTIKSSKVGKTNTNQFQLENT